MFGVPNAESAFKMRALMQFVVAVRDARRSMSDLLDLLILVEVRICEQQEIDSKSL